MLQDYGWKPHNTKYEHDWNVLRDNIQNHIKAMNFGYKSKMSELEIDYVNAFAQFENDKTVKFKFQDQDFRLKAKNFVIAAGNRPRDYPGIPDLAKYAITSDDLFSLKEDPGKTLVIGGGYIALECAGFLNGLGKDVTMINRSTFLRVMDPDMAFRIVDDMERSGVKALTETVPVGVKKIGDKLYEVDLKTKDKLHKIQVNTILVAIGRDA
jgi:thioredoxin reductase (NADPH)